MKEGFSNAREKTEHAKDKVKPESPKTTDKMKEGFREKVQDKTEQAKDKLKPKSTKESDRNIKERTEYGEGVQGKSELVKERIKPESEMPGDTTKAELTGPSEQQSSGKITA